MINCNPRTVGMAIICIAVGAGIRDRAAHRWTNEPPAPDAVDCHRAALLRVIVTVTWAKVL